MHAEVPSLVKQREKHKCRQLRVRLGCLIDAANVLRDLPVGPDRASEIRAWSLPMPIGRGDNRWAGPERVLPVGPLEGER